MEVEKAFKKLLIKNPFYGLFCLSLPKKVTKQISTLAVCPKGVSCELLINPDFWQQHTDDEQISLLTHELSHICFQHMLMVNSFKDPKIFNMAADCEVNSYIQNLPKSALTAQVLSNKYKTHIDKGLGTKKYYEIISNQQQCQAKNPQKPCNGGQGGSAPQSSSPSSAAPESPQQETPPPPTQEDQQTQEQDNQSSQQEEQEKREEKYPDNISQDIDSLDDHSTWKDFQRLPEANKQLIANNINSILKSTAEQVEKSHGTIPGEFTELIEKLRKKKPEVFNWKAYFRRMLGSIYDVNIRSTRRKESKRFAGSAGIQHKKKVSILVAVDTSASVSSKELQDFFSEIEYIYKAGARVTLIQCDTKINAVDEYDGMNIPAIKGRGGTSFDPPVDYYKKHRKDYATLIYFTDGEAPLPKEKPSGMVWVITSSGYHQDYPGKAIYIPKENN